jgi:hypothetical protein
MAGNDKQLARQSSTASQADGKKKKKRPAAQTASTTETMSFIFGCGTRNTTIWFIGMIAAFCNGAVRLSIVVDI